MRTGFPGEHPAVFSPCPTGLDYTSFFRQNKGTPRRCGGFLQSCNTEPFCMGRTVDFSGGIVYDKNGSVGTRGRKVNHVRGCCAAGTAKAGKRSGACLKETGSETPRERHCGRKDAPKRQGRRDESPPLGAPPEKVGCKRGAIGSTARGRRIARRRTKARRAFSSLCAGESMRRR